MTYFTLRSAAASPPQIFCVYGCAPSLPSAMHSSQFRYVCSRTEASISRRNASGVLYRGTSMEKRMPSSGPPFLWASWSRLLIPNASGGMAKPSRPAHAALISFVTLTLAVLAKSSLTPCSAPGMPDSRRRRKNVFVFRMRL